MYFIGNHTAMLNAGFVLSQGQKLPVTLYPHLNQTIGKLVCCLCRVGLGLLLCCWGLVICALLSAK